jgi:biopolymer transport protein ExbB
MLCNVLRIAMVVATCALGVVGSAAAQPLVPPEGEQIDLTPAFAPDIEETLKQAMAEAGDGDGKTFTITADESTNLTDVKPGDIYSGGEKTLFKVLSVEPNGTRGGTVVFQRTHGKSDPDIGFRFNRVQGAGANTIVSRIRLIDFYWAAGWPAHFITLLALGTILMTANSIWLYRHSRQCPNSFVEQARRLLSQGDISGLEEAALKRPGLFPQICRALTERFDTSTPDDIRRRVEITAVCAPLIGLAGTIYGMIIVFEGVAGATGAARITILAAGIRLKLLCTLFALMVAVPALFLFFLFNSRLSTIVARCEMLTEEFMHHIIVLKRLRGGESATAGGGNGAGARAAALAAAPVAAGGRP